MAGLGIFHGLNPAMGWLFAVALGLHRRSQRIVLIALAPIAIGHALAILVVILALLAAGELVDLAELKLGGGALLIGWAAWHALYGHRHRVRIGMQTGMLGLALWSFAMAVAHGAGLMLVPVLIPAGAMGAHVHAHEHDGFGAGPLAIAILATAVHTLAMLTTTGAIAIAVYRWIGVGVLRRGWINFDILWTVMLVAAGVWLMAAPTG